MPVLQRRADALHRIREDPDGLPALRSFYREHVAQFIIDWGCTVDARNVERGLPAVVPFLLFPKQEEWVGWVTERWKGQQPGLTEKSRDCGISWLAVAWSASMCLFYDGFTAGFGSRKEEYVDKIGEPRSLFWKGRQFISLLPVEFRGGVDLARDAPHMRIQFPGTGSLITGEAGDNIGRGDRTSAYFVDESAHIEHPELIEASLATTTNCRQDVSSVCGTDNPFAVKRFSGKIKVFTFHWRDDPRKDDAWYEKKKGELDAVTLAQEIDIDYNASKLGVLIPSVWVQSAIDACARLGITVSGSKQGALDVADEGPDLNAFCGMHGVQIEYVDEWSGKAGDIFGTTQKAFMLCDEQGYDSFLYDADGIGSGCRGDARVINENRKQDGVRLITVEAFRGSGAVVDPDKKVPGTDRTNLDFFANYKAQAWWATRERFKRTYRWVVEGKPCDPDGIISIAPNCRNREKLIMELSQPTYDINTAGKIIVNKTPEGTKSPNMADSVNMCAAGRGKKRLHITSANVAAAMNRYRRAV